jgi:hypothetical protein
VPALEFGRQRLMTGAYHTEDQQREGVLGANSHHRIGSIG